MSIKSLLRKALIFIVPTLVLTSTIVASAAVLQGFQGGTGISTSTSANDSKCLTQSSSSPFLTWTIGTCGGGGGTISGSGTSSQVAYFSASNTLTSSANLTFDGTNLTNTGTTTVGTLKLNALSTTPQIYADSDTNTGINFPGPDIMQFKTSGMTRQYFDSAGHTIIGSSTVPDDTLGVVSNGGYPIFEVYTSSTNSTAFIVANGGNVGVGTTTPGSILTVAGDGFFTGNLTAASATLSGNANVGNFLYLTSSTPPANEVIPDTNKIILHAHSVQGILEAHVHSIWTEYGCDDLVGDNCSVVKNGSGGALTIGQAVYISAGNPGFSSVNLAKANATSTALVEGLVATSSVANNGFLLVMQGGILTNVNTSAFTAGDPLYLSCTTAGALTNTRPLPPCLVARVGTVLVSNASTGQIRVDAATNVLGEETGTINTTFNIGGSLALTSSSFPIPFASTTGVQPSVSSTINGGVGPWNLVAGSNITISSSTASASTTYTIASTGGGGGGLATTTPFSVGYIPYATSSASVTNSNIYQRFVASGGSFAISGGTSSTVGIYTVLTFNTSSTLNITNGSGLNVPLNYILVGGGGGGGFGGGGGGGGGFTTGLFIATSTANLSIVVGNGGVGGTNGSRTGGEGGTSTLLSFTGDGGGGGGGFTLSGTSGGSGGGGGASGSPGGGSGITGQGQNGGSGSNPSGGGGGGGASQGGGSASSPNGGFGGNGATSTIPGVSTCYAGGGGGSSNTGTPGTAFCGGGAGGNNAAGSDGTANTGGGGGGGSDNGAGSNGGNGATGVVIIWFPTSFLNGAQSFQAVGINTTSPSSTLQVNGGVTFAGDSFVTSSLVGGQSLGAGQCSFGTSTPSLTLNLSSSTAVFITTPENFPGGGFWWSSYLSSPNVISTEVCAIVAGTPKSSSYNIKIIQ